MNRKDREEVINSVCAAVTTKLPLVLKLGNITALSPFYITQGPSEIAVTDSEGVFSIDIKEESNTVRILVRAEGFRRYNGVAQLSPGTTLIQIRLNPI